MSHAPVLYSASTIASLFNLTERRVQQLASEKIIPMHILAHLDHPFWVKLISDSGLS